MIISIGENLTGGFRFPLAKMTARKIKTSSWIVPAPEEELGRISPLSSRRLADWLLG
jgi:hypothetical protein